MTADQDRAERDAWQCTIDACLEHDCDHYRRALAALASIPSPRPSVDSPIKPPGYTEPA